ncbi:hypothetical protein AAG570_007824, partial [Ranatra chinensis]
CTGVLKHPDGFLLKPIYKEILGASEVSFYQAVANSRNNEPLYAIKCFLPKYFGTTVAKINMKEIKFLKLEDVSEGLIKPCVMDVKIGARTWDPNASAIKREIEEGKYASCKKTFGFCVPGYQLYDIVSGQFNKQSKQHCRTLNNETLPSAFREYLNWTCGLGHLLRDKFIEKLEELLQWWQIQRIYHIYSSSILLLYDAQDLEQYLVKTKALESLPLVRVYMIDFAHTFPAYDHQVDHNYINGLCSLIQILKNL